MTIAYVLAGVVLGMLLRRVVRRRVVATWVDEEGDLRWVMRNDGRVFVSVYDGPWKETEDNKTRGDVPGCGWRRPSKPAP